MYRICKTKNLAARQFQMNFARNQKQQSNMREQDGMNEGMKELKKFHDLKKNEQKALRKLLEQLKKEQQKTESNSSATNNQIK
jgi:vesicle coat complex subunit